MIASGLNQRLQDYVDGVLSGDIVACDNVRLAVMRHAKDLKRQNTDDFPYYFDDRHARLCCEFFPLVLPHSIGEFAGLPFDLVDWQVFFVASIFGWKRSSDNSRKYRRFLLEVARKNGKSTMIAGIAIFLASMDWNPSTHNYEQVAEVVLAATKKEQVQKVVYSEIERMRLQSPHLKSRSTSYNKQIKFKHNQGTISAVGSDKPYDGLNPHAVLLDEMHAWKEYHRKFYDTMQTGSGSRTQPIVGAITTAGDDQSHLWIDQHDYAVDVLRGNHSDESLFALLFGIDEKDDPFNESVWIKANPSMPVTPKLDYLREQANQAKRSRLALNRFLRYHLNVKTSSNSQAFDMTEWDNCAGQLSDWRNACAVAYGIDLGGHDDLASFAAVARFEIGEEEGKPLYRYEAKTWSFISTKSKRNLQDQPWAQWIHEGQLAVAEYATTQLLWRISEEATQTGCYAIGYDPHNAQQLGEWLTQEGFQAVRVGQTYGLFNEPICDLLKAIRERRFTHEGKTHLRWCVGNAILVSNQREQVMYDKANSSEKIDPVVALTMAFRLASIAPRAFKGSYFLA